MTSRKAPLRYGEPGPSGGTIRQELTTTSGVQVIVKDRPKREPIPKYEPPRAPRGPRVVIIPETQAEFWEMVEEQWGDDIVRGLERHGVLPRSAKDVKNRVIMIVLERNQEGRLPKDIEGYIHGIIPKVAANHRRLRRYGAVEGEDIDAYASAGADPEEAAGRAEQREKIRKYIRSLPLKYAQVVQLTDIEGMTLEDAAAMLGRPVGTVATQRTRALEMLREMAIESERHTAFGRGASPGLWADPGR